MDFKVSIKKAMRNQKYSTCLLILNFHNFMIAHLISLTLDALSIYMVRAIMEPPSSLTWVLTQSSVIQSQAYTKSRPQRKKLYQAHRQPKTPQQAIRETSSLQLRFFTPRSFCSKDEKSWIQSWTCPLQTKKLSNNWGNNIKRNSAEPTFCKKNSTRHLAESEPWFWIIFVDQIISWFSTCKSINHQEL